MNNRPRLGDLNSKRMQRLWFFSVAFALISAVLIWIFSLGDAFAFLALLPVAYAASQSRQIIALSDYNEKEASDDEHGNKQDKQ